MIAGAGGVDVREELLKLLLVELRPVGQQHLVIIITSVCKYIYIYIYIYMHHVII